MAEKDEYIGEAYEALKNMSEDEIKRMEYEARQKAIRDYNSYMHSAERRGIKSGIKIGSEVQVVITPAGKEFITPITLSALTSKPVISEFFSFHTHFIIPDSRSLIFVSTFFVFSVKSPFSIQL